MTNSMDVPTSEVEKIIKCSYSVCEFDGAAHGTGLLITPNLILTCNHVIPDPETAANITAFFKSKKEARLNPNEAHGGFFHTSTRLNGKFFDQNNLDFTLVGIEWKDDTRDLPSPIPLPAERAPLPENGDRLYEIHHPIEEKDPKTGKYKLTDKASKFSSADQANLDYLCKNDGDQPHVIHYLHMKTEAGSSGAPIFNGGGELVAIHHGKCGHRDHDNGRLGIIAREVRAYKP